MPDSVTESLGLSETLQRNRDCAVGPGIAKLRVTQLPLKLTIQRADGGVHGDDAVEVFKELLEVVEEWVEIFEKDGSPLRVPKNRLIEAA